MTAAQRIAEDFGAAIRFDMEVSGVKSSPANLVAKPHDDEFPKGAEFADKGYFIATIDYGKRGGGAWPEKGTILYLKSALIRNLDLRAKGYRGAHADFPNQSTGDQFFDVEQFEAYREVGYRICAQMLDDLKLCDLFARQQRPSLAKLRRGETFKPKGEVA